jgi:hypothetical protein
VDKFHLSRRLTFPPFSLIMLKEEDSFSSNLLGTQGFPAWMTWGSLVLGWALAHQGQVKEGIVQINQGMMAWRATGAALGQPYWLALLADAYGIIGQPEAGLTVLTEALTLADTTGER